MHRVAAFDKPDADYMRPRVFAYTVLQVHWVTELESETESCCGESLRDGVNDLRNTNQRRIGRSGFHNRSLGDSEMYHINSNSVKIQAI